jgi:hypothetical protein
MRDVYRMSNRGTPFRGLSVATLADNLKGAEGNLRLFKLFLWLDIRPNYYTVHFTCQ